MDWRGQMVQQEIHSNPKVEHFWTVYLVVPVPKRGVGTSCVRLRSTSLLGVAHMNKKSTK